MKHKPDTAYIAAWRKQLRRERIHGSWLRAKHKRITAKCAAIEAARKAA